MKPTLFGSTINIRVPNGQIAVDMTQEDIIESNRILRQAVKAALDTKASELSILNVEGQTSFCDWFLLCNGHNSRQIKAIAHRIIDDLKKELGVHPMGIEGLDQGRWVLIDLGDIIVHVFDEPMRGYYDLDGLWLDAKRVSPDELGLDAEPKLARSFATSA